MDTKTTKSEMLYVETTMFITFENVTLKIIVVVLRTHENVSTILEDYRLLYPYLEAMKSSYLVSYLIIYEITFFFQTK